ncbi:unnamed protein product [Penicillium discolor]
MISRQNWDPSKMLILVAPNTFAEDFSRSYVLSQPSCLIEIAEDMHTTVSVVNLSIAFGSLSVAIMPLWWSYLAEIYGRQLVYISERSYSGLKME